MKGLPLYRLSGFEPSYCETIILKTAARVCQMQPRGNHTCRMIVTTKRMYRLSPSLTATDKHFSVTNVDNVYQIFTKLHFLTKFGHEAMRLNAFSPESVIRGRLLGLFCARAKR